MISAREAAYLALIDSSLKKGFIPASLEAWRLQANPSSQELQLAKQLSFGTCQMANALEYLGLKLSRKGKLHLKKKERMLLHLSLYQLFFMERIPSYAATSSMVDLAKKYAGAYFAKFLNAQLRKGASCKESLLNDLRDQEASILFSYPKEFVDSLMDQVGQEKTREILVAGNIPAQVQARVRDKSAWEVFPFLEPLEQVEGMAKCKDLSQLSLLASSPLVYIQNSTPYQLMRKLAEKAPSFKRVLDLCASPGGKLIMAHDLFPGIKAFANDVSEEKMVKVKQNLQKYHIEASLSVCPGEHYPSSSSFDLILCDVPCSNSGVLNKRPEARWRLSKSSLNEQIELQKALLAHAATLLAPGGEIWYMTCSILQEENHQLVHEMAKKLGVVVRQEILHLPTKEGQDGGYGAALKHV